MVKRKLAIAATLGLLAVSVAGCSTTGVYSSEFKCASTYNGRCVTPQQAYEIARSGKDSPEHDPAVNEQQDRDDVAPKLKREGGADGDYTEYKRALYKKMTGLLKEDKTPLLAPPQVARVLVMPYKGDNGVLYMQRTLYVILGEPRFVLGDALSEMQDLED